MARFIIPLIIVYILFFFIEWYAYQAFKTLVKGKLYRWIWFAVNSIAYIQLLVVIFTQKERGQTLASQFSFGVLLWFLLPKLIVILFLFGEDVWRWFSHGLRNDVRSALDSQKHIPGRRKFVSQLALGIAAIPFASFLYGMVRGKYNYKVLKYELAFEDLPEAFDGFTLTQISDIHSGSFTNRDKVQYAIDLIQEQNSDMILFTGDIVNNKAEEMDGFVDMFSKLKAPFGKYSVLGNHDYGDYADWKSDEAKKANFQAIKDIHPKIGFDLLLNESRHIEKDGQQIALIGVENWGKGWKQAGDLEKATEKVNQEDFKVLMSHDPSHWEYRVKEDEFNYHLTLSGHTHGLQMGIEIPGFVKISPSRFFYKQWAGLYEEFGRYVNVNRGFGYHGFPGRVGIWPEITVIKLKKGQKVS